MAEKMSKRERVLATLRGQPVDRPAFAFWGHHYDAEYSLGSHVSQVLWWQTALDMDFLKVQNRASFHVEDWGVRLRYPPVQPFVGVDMNYEPPADPLGRPVVEDYPVKNPKDWDKIQVLKPDVGALGERLVALRMIREGLKKISDDVPIFIETIFTPLSITARLLGWEGTDFAKLDVLQEHLRKYPEVLHRVQDVVTETYCAYARECIKAGAGGFMFATTNWATYDRWTIEEYNEHARPYDLRVLEAMREADFILLHVCKQNIMLFDLADYPVHAFNWAAHEPGNPSLKEVLDGIPDKTLVGGIDRSKLGESTADIPLQQARKAWNETGGRRWICGPDCVVPGTARVENMRAVGDYLRKGKP